MPTIDSIKEQVLRIWSEAVEIWATGGWGMVAIAVIALLMAAMGFHVLFKLRAKKIRNVREREWRRWIDHPEARHGRLGELMDFVLSDKSLKEVSLHFDQLRASEAAPFERDLKVMKICVSAAPLVGLLGTVTGMLATFGALSSGSGGDQTMGMIAAGISEALITTETGLVIALPGLFFHHFLVRKFEDYKLFLAHLETVCTQTIYRRSRQAEEGNRLSIEEVGTRLRARLQANGYLPADKAPARNGGRTLKIGAMEFGLSESKAKTV